MTKIVSAGHDWQRGERKGMGGWVWKYRPTLYGVTTITVREIPQWKMKKFFVLENNEILRFHQEGYLLGITHRLWFQFSGCLIFTFTFLFLLLYFTFLLLDYVYFQYNKRNDKIRNFSERLVHHWVKILLLKLVIGNSIPQVFPLNL